MVPYPTPAEVVTFLGWPASTPAEQVATIQAHLDTATRMVRAYTRGRGFDRMDEAEQVEDDVAAVIVSSVARSAMNPTHDRRVEAGNFNSVPGTFEGWTLAELAVLHRYRRLAT